MNTVSEFQLPFKYHQALSQWQRKNFPDFHILLNHWEKYYPAEQSFRLTVKIAPLKNKTIEAGYYKNMEKIQRADQMKGNMLYSALRLIKAQCSAELGSIQQHITTVDQAP